MTQPLKQLDRHLASLADETQCLFTVDDLHVIVPALSREALRAVLSRARFKT